MRMGTNNTYPGFGHPASELSAFTNTLDVFIISLKDGAIVQFTPEDTHGFLSWLQKNSVRNINTDEPYQQPPRR